MASLLVQITYFQFFFFIKTQGWIIFYFIWCQEKNQKTSPIEIKHSSFTMSVLEEGKDFLLTNFIQFLFLN
jgi:hypothetical protein